jgi:carbamoyl-phosphate synthase small subunit
LRNTNGAISGNMRPTLLIGGVFMRAMLALEDGTVFDGKAFGALGEQWGEVVFNTGMTGYQEVLTDPSYCGQIVVMTYPLIGNYGIIKEDFESQRSYVRGFVVREECRQPNNWRLSETIDSFLKKEGVIGLSGVDTRSLTRRLRSYGAMRGVISTDTAGSAALVEKAKNCPHLTGQELAPMVATRDIYTLPGSGYRIMLIDFGAKLNIIRCLRERGCEVVVAPPTTSAGDVLAMNPEGSCFLTVPEIRSTCLML